MIVRRLNRDAGAVDVVSRSIATRERDYSGRIKKEKKRTYVTGVLCTGHVLGNTSVKLSAVCFGYNKISRTQSAGNSRADRRV